MSTEFYLSAKSQKNLEIWPNDATFKTARSSVKNEITSGFYPAGHWKWFSASQCPKQRQISPNFHGTDDSEKRRVGGEFPFMLHISRNGGNVEWCEGSCNDCSLKVTQQIPHPVLEILSFTLPYQRKWQAQFSIFTMISSSLYFFRRVKLDVQC